MDNAGKRARAENSAQQISVFAHILDIHSSSIISAFDRQYSENVRFEVRQGSRELVRTTLINDTRDAADAITRVSRRLTDSEQEFAVASSACDRLISRPSSPHELISTLEEMFARKDAAKMVGCLGRDAAQRFIDVVHEVRPTVLRRCGAA